MTLQEVSPRKVLAQVAAAIPEEIHPNIVIIGSLAAGSWLFQRGDATFGIRTKDVDRVLSPHVSAVEKGRAVAEPLLGAGWLPRDDGEFANPGDVATSTDRLPAVRLYPPGQGEWFVELLTAPASGAQEASVLNANGLLSRPPATPAELRIAGERLLTFTVDPLATAGEGTR